MKLCKRLPRLWNRFPRSYVEDIISSMIKLISITNPVIQPKQQKKGTKFSQGKANKNFNLYW